MCVSELLHERASERVNAIKSDTYMYGYNNKGMKNTITTGSKQQYHIENEARKTTKQHTYSLTHSHIA